jgi:hypothetical protein
MCELLPNVPAWLAWPQGINAPSPDQMEAARKEMYEALRLFHDHVKYVVYVLASILAAPLLILRILPSVEQDPVFHLVAGLILLFIPPLIGILSVNVIRRYYEVYVSALVYATKIHVALREVNTHPWVLRTILQAVELGARATNSIQFMEARAKSKNDTFHYYRWIILALSLASLVCGIIMLATGWAAFLNR